jgi:hypothetical protein
LALKHSNQGKDDYSNLREYALNLKKLGVLKHSNQGKVVIQILENMPSK